MSLAWPDEDFVDGDSDAWDDLSAPDNDDEERDEPSGLRCAGVLAWIGGGDLYGHRFVRTGPESSPVWHSLAESELFACRWWSEPSRPMSDRLWRVLSAIEVAVGELDAAPMPPEHDVESVARSLETLAQRLVRLERALPFNRNLESELYESHEPQRRISIDWREINREQAKALPHGLLSEDGSPLDLRRRLTVFDVFVEEDDAEESLLE